MRFADSLLDFLEWLGGVRSREAAWTAESGLSLLNCFQGGVEEIEDFLELVELEVDGASTGRSGERFVIEHQRGDLRLNLAYVEVLLGELVVRLLSLGEVRRRECIVVLAARCVIVVLLVVAVMPGGSTWAGPVAALGPVADLALGRGFGLFLVRLRLVRLAPDLVDCRLQLRHRVCWL